jgi:hypothetical protein
MSLGRALCACLLASAVVGLAPALAADPGAQALLLKHAELRQALDDNPFQRPLILESSAPAGRLQGDVYARIDRPFGAVRDALRSMDHWCDILVLHLNVKGCRASDPRTGDSLSVWLGKQTDQALADAYRVDFRFARLATGPEYLQVALSAARGPLGTSRYRIVLEAVPLDAGRSVIHLSYSYSFGMVAGIAMRGYLATSGRDKVGFSAVGLEGGVRGVVERNTMRYYLAIEAYLGALPLPEAERAEQRVSDWFASTERYARQLHEIEREAYVAMKRREIRRQTELGPLPDAQ